MKLFRSFELRVLNGFIILMSFTKNVPKIFMILLLYEYLYLLYGINVHWSGLVENMNTKQKLHVHVNSFL